MLLISTAATAGRLVVTFEAVAAPDERDIIAFTMRSGVVEDTLDVVSDEFVLPRDVRLLFGGDDGPLYDPALTQITIPYFFIQEVDARIESLSPDLTLDERDAIVLGVLEHTLYHELGHAIAELLDLEFTGREEDAVDTLATLLMIESFEDGDLAVLDAMEDFYALDELEGGADKPAFFAEHSLDITRYRSGVCLVYGSDPERHAELLDELGVDAARACENKWARALAQWERRLQPILKPI